MLLHTHSPKAETSAASTRRHQLMRFSPQILALFSCGTFLYICSYLVQLQVSKTWLPCTPACLGSEPPVASRPMYRSTKGLVRKEKSHDNHGSISLSACFLSSCPVYSRWSCRCRLLPIPESGPAAAAPPPQCPSDPLGSVANGPWLGRWWMYWPG